MLSPVEAKERAKRYPHTAIELWKGVLPSPSSDMYSYGYFLKQILNCLDSQKLRSLHMQCRTAAPIYRPTAVYCSSVLQSTD